LEGRAFQDKEHGLKGIKFILIIRKFFVDDKKMFPIYETAFGLGLIVVFHAGVDIGLPAPYHATPERLEKIVYIIQPPTEHAWGLGIAFYYWNGL